VWDPGHGRQHRKYSGLRRLSFVLGRPGSPRISDGKGLPESPPAHGGRSMGGKVLGDRQCPGQKRPPPRARQGVRRPAALFAFFSCPLPAQPFGQGLCTGPNALKHTLRDCRERALRGCGGRGPFFRLSCGLRAPGVVALRDRKAMSGKTVIVVNGTNFPALARVTNREPLMGQEEAIRFGRSGPV